MVCEDALSIYDLAKVCSEASCRHAPLTNWLNRYADQPEAELAKLRPPEWALAGLAWTKRGYWAQAGDATSSIERP